MTRSGDAHFRVIGLGAVVARGTDQRPDAALVPYDAAAYRDGNLMDRAFYRLNDWQRIATRYDKLAINFASAIAIAASLI